MDDVDAATSAPEPPPARSQRRRELRALLLWLLGIGVTVGLAGVAAIAGIALAAFGAAGVALAIAVLGLAIVLVVWRRGVLPAAVLTAALTLPAAAVALSTARIDPSHGTLIIRPTEPRDVASSGYVHGVGPVLVDLRGFNAPARSSTSLAVRADTGRVVVALPRDRCFNLDVRYHVDRTSKTKEFVVGSLGLVGIARDPLGGSSSNSLYLSREAQRTEDLGLGQAQLDYPDLGVPPQFELLAYGRSAIAMPAGRWTHPALAAAAAPTLRLDLTSDEQIVVRDYPDWVGPLSNSEWEQDSGTRWPMGLQAPPSPGERQWRTRASIRTPQNRARWVKWEREMVPWAQEQAARFAGHCATRQELRDREVTFLTQAERVRGSDGKVRSLLGGPTTRHSAIEQPAVTSPQTLLVVAVNGLGEAKVVSRVAMALGGDADSGEVIR